MVTGSIIKPMGDLFIKATRFFELAKFSEQEWQSEVKRIQNYLSTWK